MKKYKKLFWPRVCKTFIVLNLTATLLTAIKYCPLYMNLWNEDKSSKYTLQLKQEDTILYIDGDLEFGISNDIEKILEANPQIKGLMLNTFGGIRRESLLIAKLITQYQLDTYAFKECISGGMIAFVAGKKRYLVEGTLMGFHRGGILNEEVVLFGEIQGLREITSDLTGSIVSHFEQNGVDPNFIEKAMKVPLEEVWFPRYHELLNAGVIHGIVDSNLVFKKDISEVYDCNELDALFRSVSDEDLE